MGVVGAELRYVPDTGFAGTDAFTYTVIDAQGFCSTAPVTVHIPVVTEVLPRPPITRSPTLPDTGSPNVGWAALLGLLLIGAGGLLWTGSARLDRRPAVTSATTATDVPEPAPFAAPNPPAGHCETGH